jgi:GNAT superfamily N-acetyltransferase
VASFTLERLDAAATRDAAADLATVLMDCVEGGASVNFMWPLSREKAVAFWARVADGIAEGERAAMLVARAPAGTIVGTVHLILAMQENQPHRAEATKLLVHRSARRQGIAEALMRELESHALAIGRPLLVLDTVTGSDAERLYHRLGWMAIGVVPDYALFPDGRPCSTTYFYRWLTSG